MTGNAWEWCSDRYGDYEPGEVTDPMGHVLAAHRVDRGGGWADGAGRCRSACRGVRELAYRYRDLGFRVAAVPPGPVSVQGRQ